MEALTWRTAAQNIHRGCRAIRSLARRLSKDERRSATRTSNGGGGAVVVVHTKMAGCGEGDPVRSRSIGFLFLPVRSAVRFQCALCACVMTGAGSMLDSSIDRPLLPLLEWMVQLTVEPLGLE